MSKELYLDLSIGNAGGSLYKIVEPQGGIHFYYNHSTYNPDTDELAVFDTVYPDFLSAWTAIIKNKNWQYGHPLFVHPDHRTYIENLLKQVNWQQEGDARWQDSHRRQWKKVLTDPAAYYNGPA